MEENDIEIIDPENYGGSSKENFDHQVLVMICIKNCIEAGSKELRAGYNNIKTDKQGNETMIPVEDTRKRFIWSVKMCKAVMSCDFDTNAKKVFVELDLELGKVEGEFINQQNTWWNSLDTLGKKKAFQNNQQVIKGRLNKNLPLYDFLVDEQLEIYLEIFEELNELTERIGFYETKEAGN